MTTTIEDLDKRMLVLEGQVKAVTHVTGEIDRRYRAASEVLGYMQVEFKVVRSDIAELRDRLTNVEGRLTNVEDRLTKVEERLTNVEDRLVRVEERQIGQDAILRSHGEMLKEILRRLPPAA